MCSLTLRKIDVHRARDSTIERMRTHRLTVVVALAYLVFLALVALWPTHVDENLAVVDWSWVRWMGNVLDLTPAQSYDVVEFSANVALFVPFGVVASLQLRRWPLALPVIIGALVSVCIELAQHTLRPERTASLGDVVANSIGALIGVVLHHMISRR